MRNGGWGSVAALQTKRLRLLINHIPDRTWRSHQNFFWTFAKNNQCLSWTSKPSSSLRINPELLLQLLSLLTGNPLKYLWAVMSPLCPSQAEQLLLGPEERRTSTTSLLPQTSYMTTQCSSSHLLEYTCHFASSLYAFFGPFFGPPTLSDPHHCKAWYFTVWKLSRFDDETLEVSNHIISTSANALVGCEICLPSLSQECLHLHVTKDISGSDPTCVPHAIPQ